MSEHCEESLDRLFMEKEHGESTAQKIGGGNIHDWITSKY
jgi:hypothetical protein